MRTEKIIGAKSVFTVKKVMIVGMSKKAAPNNPRYKKLFGKKTLPFWGSGRLLRMCERTPLTAAVLKKDLKPLFIETPSLGYSIPKTPPSVNYTFYDLVKK